jgi:GlpG protein
MRTIGNFATEDAAARFSAFLEVRGIENQFEAEDDGTFSLWIMEEDRVKEAAELLAKFRGHPDAPEFAKAASAAEKQRREQSKAEAARRATVADTARIGYEQHFQAAPYVTYALIVASVAVAIYSHLGDDWHALRGLSMTEVHVEGGFAIMPGLPEIRAGQIWRLITPIFIHFGPLHLVFNMMLLKDLGTFIESRFGGRYLVGLIIVTAVISNYAQYLWNGPAFGGMSGVDYALFGFLWMRGKYDPASQWQLNKNTVYALIGWFVICVLGIIPNVANGAHGAGLAAGMAWGYLSARRPFSR